MEGDKDLKIIKSSEQFKKNITLYLPTLIDFIGSEIDWEKLLTIYTQTYEKRYELANGKTIRVSANIYDFIIQSSIGNIDAQHLLNYSNHIFNDLNQNLKPIEKLKARKNIWDLLQTMDNRFFNFLGEVSVLNSMIKSNYSLIDIEFGLTNGKSIDFKFKNLSSHEFELVEVMNIHPNEFKTNINSIGSFIKNKVENKINIKKEGINNELNIIVIPVIWGNSNVLKLYSDFFQNNTIENVIEPMAFSTVKIETPSQIPSIKFEYRFRRVSKLFTIE